MDEVESAFLLLHARAGNAVASVFLWTVWRAESAFKKVQQMFFVLMFNVNA